MKTIMIIMKYLTILLTVFSSAFSIPTNQSQPYEAIYDNLGIPLKDYYTEGIPARTAWDLEIHDNKLFVASGDYDKNLGPVQIYHYDLNQKQWTHSGTVSDEQIEHFHLIDGKLMAPGSDPKQDWSWGNIYIYENDQWITKRTIPGGIHQFDMIYFDQQIFVALGVLPGQQPIAVSTDGGNTFQQVPMYKNGELISKNIDPSGLVRCYDFFTCNDSLFAFFYYSTNDNYEFEIYRFHNDAFYYHSNLPESLSFRRTGFEIFKAKVELENRVYFTTGKLYVSDDMQTAEEIMLEDNVITTDLRVIHNRLYAVTVKKINEDEYQTSLWVKNYFSRNKFEKLFYFSFQSPAQCFTHHNDYFYFGMGDGTLSESDSTNGTVLSVKYHTS